VKALKQPVVEIVDDEASLPIQAEGTSNPTQRQRNTVQPA
jgi:hypothetical protein